VQLQCVILEKIEIWETRSIGSGHFAVNNRVVSKFHERFNDREILTVEGVVSTREFYGAIRLESEEPIAIKLLFPRAIEDRREASMQRDIPLRR
jgi:hypothetical protein